MTVTDSVSGLSRAVFSEQDKADAVNCVTRVNAAWDANDADAFADVYAEDATLILSGDRFFRGRDHIARELALSFAGPHKGTRLLADVVSFQVLGPQLAVMVTEGGVLLPGDAEPNWERALRATWVVGKEGGEWKVLAYQNGRRADGALRGEEH